MLRFVCLAAVLVAGVAYASADGALPYSQWTDLTDKLTDESKEVSSPAEVLKVLEQLNGLISSTFTTEDGETTNVGPSEKDYYQTLLGFAKAGVDKCNDCEFTHRLLSQLYESKQFDEFKIVNYVESNLNRTRSACKEANAGFHDWTEVYQQILADRTLEEAGELLKYAGEGFCKEYQTMGSSVSAGEVVSKGKAAVDDFIQLMKSAENCHDNFKAHYDAVLSKINESGLSIFKEYIDGAAAINQDTCETDEDEDDEDVDEEEEQEFEE